MTLDWELTFEFAYPVERVWSAYFEHEGAPEGEPPSVGTTFKRTDAAGTDVEITSVVRHERFSWADTVAEGRATTTMSFESTETGTRITVTRFGFGEGGESEILRRSRALGWEESMRDLAAYLETGISARRHLEDRSSTGVLLDDSFAGLRVLGVRPGALGEEAGLQPGDLVLWVNGAAVYRRADMWLLARLWEPGTEVEIGFARDGQVMSGRGRMSPVEMAVVGELGLGPRDKR